MEVALASSSEKQVWITDYLKEYVRLSSFADYMGKGSTSIFRIRSELMNEAGKTINIPLITRLKGSGVTGSEVLDGNEEDLGNYNCQIQVDWLRNGVRVPKSTSYLTEIDLWNAAKDMLKTWSAEQLRDGIIQALHSVVIAGSTGQYDTTVNYASATSTQLNAFGANNSDRVLFGHTKSNYNATWATALSNISSSSDKLSAAVGSLAKRMAKLAGQATSANPNPTSPHIRPFMVPEIGREYYVMFCHPYAFRDLKADTTMSNASAEARAREGEGMKKNPLFQDGDLIYDGVIYREVPELVEVTIAGAGSGSIDVAPNFLCGQSAVGIAWGQQPTPRTDMIKDYGFRPGTAIEELRGQRKISFSGVQYGMVSVYTAGVSD